MLTLWERFSYFLSLPNLSAYYISVYKMVRNTPMILPFCQHCGIFKGVGPCRNPECDKTNHVSIGFLQSQSSKCIVCSKDGDHSCSRCGISYCAKHAVGKDGSVLSSLEQHLGTCVICGEVICEHCWIFNGKGSITCLVHSKHRNDL